MHGKINALKYCIKLLSNEKDSNYSLKWDFNGLKKLNIVTLGAQIGRSFY